MRLFDLYYTAMKELLFILFFLFMNVCYGNEIARYEGVTSRHSDIKCSVEIKNVIDITHIQITKHKKNGQDVTMNKAARTALFYRGLVSFGRTEFEVETDDKSLLKQEKGANFNLVYNSKFKLKYISVTEIKGRFPRPSLSCTKLQKI